MTDHQRISEGLLSAWALDAVDESERVEVERAIASDPAVAARAQRLQATVAAVASADAVEPPSELRAKVLDQVAALQPDVGLDGPEADESTDEHSIEETTLRAVESRRERRSARGRIGQWLAAAAVLVVAVALPTGIAVQQANRAEQAENQVQAVVEALADPEAVVHSAPVDGGGRAVAVTAPSGVLFAMEGVGEPGDAHDYQLWRIGPQGPVSEGVLPMTQASRGVDVGDVGAATALAVTVEPNGGSSRPTTEPIVTVDLAP